VLTPLNKTASGRSFAFCDTLSLLCTFSTQLRHRSLFRQ
jgi:hypothetical protein